MKNEKINLPILLIVTLLLSLTVYLRTYIISIDGVFQYIPLAKSFVSGSFREGLEASGQQPLYSFLIALAYRWVPDFEMAGRLVASLFGVLLIFPVYFLGKRIFDQRTAFFSTLLLSLHPYVRRFSADVLKESCYLFFLATALWFSWRTIEKQKKYPYLLIPFLAVLAYLARPDGVEILLVVFFYTLFIKKFNASYRKLEVIFLLVLSSTFLFLPYLMHLKEMTGEWTLSRAKSITGLIGLEVMADEISLITKILLSLKKLNLEFFAKYHPLYIFLLAIGLSKRNFLRLKEGEKFLFFFFILHYMVTFSLVVNSGYWKLDESSQTRIFSGRHILPLSIFSIYWVGEGFIYLHDWLSHRMRSSKIAFLSGPKERALVAWFILFLLALTIILPKTLKPQRYERLPEKWAGRWIKTQYGQGARIVTTVPRVAFYADGYYEYIDLGRVNADQIGNAIIGKRASFLVLRDSELDHFPQEVIKKDFIELNRFEGKGMKTVIIYKKAH